MLHIEVDIMPRAKRSIRKSWSKMPSSKGFETFLIPVTTSTGALVPVLPKSQGQPSPNKPQQPMPQPVSVEVTAGMSPCPHVIQQNLGGDILLEPPPPPSTEAPINLKPATDAANPGEYSVALDDLPKVRKLFQTSVQCVEEFKIKELTKATSMEEAERMTFAIDLVKENINYQWQLLEEVHRGFEIIRQLRNEQTTFQKKFLTFRAKFYSGWNIMSRVGLGNNQYELSNLRSLSETMKETSLTFDCLCRKLDEVNLKNKRQDDILSVYCKKMEKCIVKCNEFGESLSFEQFQTIGLPDVNWEKRQLSIHRNSVDIIKNRWNEFEARETANLDEWLESLAEICLIFGIHHLQNPNYNT